MKLRFLGGRFQGRVVDVPGDSFTIGRGQRNDLALDQDGVSRYHCKLICENGSWYIEDLESTNGVRLNGNRITGKQPIRAGDRIGISGNLLLFSEDSAEETGARLIDSLKNLEHSRHAVALDSDAKTQPEVLGDAAPEQPERDDEEDADVPAFPWFRVMALGVVLLLFLMLGVDHVRRTMSGGQSDSEAVAETEDAAETDDDSLWAESRDAADSDGEPEGELERQSNHESASPQPPDTGEDEASEGDGRDAADAAEQDEPPAATWYAVLRSEPSGAMAFVDDKEAGTTPLAVELEAGRHRLLLKKDGYEDLQRLIDDGVLQPRKPLTMRQKPGTLKIRTAPSGASVLHGRQLLGTTPVLITTLPKGEHPITLKKHGYETEEEVFEVSEVQGNEKTIELTARVGTLEVVSLPPGCTVRVDGVRKGDTQAGGEGLESVPLTIPDLLEGKHELRVAHPMAGDRSGTVRISLGEVERRQVRFWVPDHQVTLKNGKQVYGMRMPDAAQGEIVLLDREWKNRRFADGAVKEVEKLSPDAVRRILENREEAPEDLEADEDEVDAAKVAEPDFQLEAEEFDEEIRQTTVGDLRNQFEDKTVRAHGVPRKIIAADQVVHVWLGDSIHCRLNADLLSAVRAAKKADKPLYLQGTVAQCTGDEIVMGDCIIVPDHL